MNGTAKELYETGVTKSFEQWGAPLNEYLSDSESKPAKFTAVPSTMGTQNAVSTITIAWDEE